MHEDDTEDIRLLDGIRVVDKPRIALVRTNPKAVLMLLISTGILASITAFVLTHFRTSPALPEPASLTPATVATSTDPHTYFTRWNFSALLPEDWAETNEAGALPAHTTSLTPTYVRADHACMLTYAAVDRGAYIPSDTGHVVYHADKILTRIESVSEDFDEGATDSALPNVLFAYAYYPLFYDNGSDGASNNAWVLYTGDAAPLPEACMKDFAAFLETLSPFYTSLTLTTRDTGLLYVESDENTGSHLLFRNDRDDTGYELATLDAGMTFKPTVIDTTLYYVGTRGDLHRYTLFGDTTPNTVPIALPEETSVNDFLPVGTMLYYLAGTWCRTQDTACDLTLYQYDTDTASTTALYEHSTDSDLRGMTDDGSLCLTSTNHDDTILRGSWHTFTPETNEYREVYAYEIPKDDTDAVASLRVKLDTFTATCTKQGKEVASLKLDHGTVSEGPDHFEGVEPARLPILLNE